MADEQKLKREKSDDWERDLVRDLAQSSLIEKRRARRWGVFFKLLTFGYLVALLVLWWPDDWRMEQIKQHKAHTALVDVSGVIADGEEASADNVAAGLRAAFEDKKTKAVILRINSPGGSPVQSSYIYKEIRRLREKHEEIPLYAVVSDVCASGGYYVAAAADRIFVNESSVIGSIGVLMSSFGFVETLKKLGVERRLMTAGEHKGIMDPFSPVDEYEQGHVRQLLDQLHEEFIAAVRQGRGDKLKESEKLFSGLFWTGKEGIELGLADDFGSAGSVARDIVGEEKIVDFTPKEDVLERLASRLGAGAVQAFTKVFGLQSVVPPGR